MQLRCRAVEQLLLIPARGNGRQRGVNKCLALRVERVSLVDKQADAESRCDDDSRGQGTKNEEEFSHARFLDRLPNRP